MIFRYEIDAMITKLGKAGIDAIKDEYVIVAGDKVKFDGDLYPIQIVTSFSVPDSVAFIVPRKIAEAIK